MNISAKKGAEPPGWRRTLFFWLVAGWLFWLIEIVIGFLPHAAFFGLFNLFGNPVNLKESAYSFLIQTVLFGLVGFLWLLIEVSLKKLFRLSNPGAWHSMGCVAFQVILVGSVTIPRLVVSQSSMFHHMAWIGAIALLSLAALALALIFVVAPTLAVGRLHSAPVFMSLWLFPVFQNAQSSGGIFSSPFQYFLFVAVGLGLSVIALSLGGRSRAKKDVVRGPFWIKVGAVILPLIALFAIWTGSWWQKAMELTPADAAGPRPNILLIVLDTVRASDLSCYGYELPTTPTLERLAAEGVLFKNAMSASNWTVPGHASIFTGQYPGEHLATGLNPILLTPYPTMAQILSRLEYRTFCFSANPWVSESSVLTKGFWYSKVLSAENGELIPVWRKWGVYLEAFKGKLFNLSGKSISRKDTLWRPPSSSSVIGEVIKLLGENSGDKEPFFIFINLMDAHSPYRHPSHPDISRFFPNKEAFKGAVRPDPSFADYYAGKIRYKQKDFRDMRRIYDAQIRHMDDQLARLFAQLKRLQLWDDTVVIVTSDHGEYFGERDLMGHCLAVGYSTLGIPLIAYNLPDYGKGEKPEELVQNIDILPTILDILDVQWESRDELPGYSLLKSQAGRTGRADSYPVIFKVNRVKNISPEASEKLYRRTGVIWEDGYEYIWSSKNGSEMYHYHTDPSEKKDIKKQMPELAGKKIKEAKEWINRSPGTPSGKVGINLSEKQKKRLRALGYMK